jgi:ferric-dicitrate binding protein FerR (iron transport regulator)
MAEARATIHKRRRQRERRGALAAFALAAIAGLLAAYFGTHRVWENSRATTPTSTSTSVPFVEPPRIP